MGYSNLGKSADPGCDQTREAMYAHVAIRATRLLDGNTAQLGMLRRSQNHLLIRRSQHWIDDRSAAMAVA